MRLNTKTKLGFYLGAIFVAGAVSGGVIAWRKAEEAGRPPSVDKVCHRMQKDLKVKLGLTDQEFARLRPILEETTQDLRRIQSRTQQDLEAAIRRRNEALARVLTPAQRRKLEEIDFQRCMGGAGAAKWREPSGDRSPPSKP